MRMRWISIFSLLSIGLAGCGASQVNAGNAPTLTPLQPKETDSLSTPLPAAPGQEGDMPQDPALPIPAIPGSKGLIEKAEADLAQRLSIPASQINAKGIREVFWPDASLGCPQPGIAYAQTEVPGYLIVLEAGGNKFEYHANIHNYVFYCENPTPPVMETPEGVNP